MTKDELEKKVEELTGIIEEKDYVISERDTQIANLQSDIEEMKANLVDEIPQFDPVWLYNGGVETGVMVESQTAYDKLVEQGYASEPK